MSANLLELLPLVLKQKTAFDSDFLNLLIPRLSLVAKPDKLTSAMAESKPLEIAIVREDVTELLLIGSYPVLGLCLAKVQVLS